MFLLLSLLSIFGSQAHAFDMGQLERLVEEKKISSLESLIEHFPEDLRRNYTLQHTSSGLQEAGFDFPRVFLFGKTGKFVATFNGDASQQSFNKMEVLQFNDRAKNFELFELGFDSNRKLQVERNPAKCMACHANSRGDIHPIFQEYDIWTGFFGSHADSPLDVAKEAEKLIEFNANREQHPRYKHLLLHPTQVGQELAPYYRPKKDAFYYESMPNIRLMDYLHWLNGMRITERVRAMPQYEKILPLLIYFSNDMARFSTKRNDFSLNDYFGRIKKVFSEAEMAELVKNFYALFGLQPRPGQLSITRQEFYGLLGFDIGDFSMEPGIGTKFEFHLGLSGDDPEFVNGAFFEDFRREYPNFGARYQIRGLNELAAPLVKTPFDKEFVDTIDSYGKLGGVYMFQFTNKDLEFYEIVKRSLL